MTTYTVPQLLRTTALLIRLEHGPACTDHHGWADAADLFEQSADQVDAGLTVCTKDALDAATAYLGSSRQAMEACP